MLFIANHLQAAYATAILNGILNRVACKHYYTAHIQAPFSSENHTAQID